MWLFLILLMPLALAAQFCFDGALGRRISAGGFLAIVIGVVAGCVFLFSKSLFFNFSYNFPADFFRSFGHLYLFEFVLPFFGCAVLLLIFSADRGMFLVENLYSIYAGFLIVALPYNVLSSNFSNCAFSLFCKPILFAVLVIALKNSLAFFFENLQSPLLLVASVFVFLVSSLIPAIVESMWLCGIAWYFIAIVSLLYAGAVFAFGMFARR